MFCPATVHPFRISVAYSYRCNRLENLAILENYGELPDMYIHAHTHTHTFPHTLTYTIRWSKAIERIEKRLSSTKNIKTTNKERGRHFDFFFAIYVCVLSIPFTQPKNFITYILVGKLRLCTAVHV